MAIVPLVRLYRRHLTYFVTAAATIAVPVGAVAGGLTVINTLLLLATGGIIGIVTYLAESTRRDLAVMMMLGSTHANVIAKNVTSATGPTAIGILVGICCGAVASKALESSLFGIDAMRLDPYGETALVVFVTSLGAGLIGSLRLKTLTPLEVIRRSIP